MKLRRLFITAALVLLSATTRAQEWAAYGTISAEPTAGRVCTGDANGKDILCASPAPYVDASGNVGIGTATPASRLTLQSNATGAVSGTDFMLYGTTDYTNYDRLSIHKEWWGPYIIATEKGGTGSYQILSLASGTTSFSLDSSSGRFLLGTGTANIQILPQTNKAVEFYSDTRSTANIAGISFRDFGNFTAASGTSKNVEVLGTFAPTSGAAKFIGLDVAPTVNQSGTATGDYTALQIRPTITAATGTNKFLIHAGTTASPDFFVLTQAGNIGIGTAGPVESLHVQGNIAANSIYLSDDSAANKKARWYMAGGGYVNLSLNGSDVLSATATDFTLSRNLILSNTRTISLNGGTGGGALNINSWGVPHIVLTRDDSDFIQGWDGGKTVQKFKIMGSGGAYFLSSVGIGTATPATTALLDVFSTTKGFLPPRMTTAQRDAISAPAAGLTVYNSTTNALNLYTGSSWTSLGSGLATNFAAGSVGAPGLYVTGDTNTGLYQATADTLSITAGGVEAARFNTAASGVNYFNFTPSATGNVLTMSAAGTDTNIGIRLTPKGGGSVGIGVNPSGLAQLEVTSSSIANGIYISQVRTTGVNVALNARAGGSGATTNIAGYFAPDGATNNYAILIPLNYPPAGPNNYAIRSESTAQNYFAGNVGIGTTSPAEKLEVAGNIKASGTLQVANSAATCTGAADYGKFRYNPVNGKLQICKP